MGWSGGSTSYAYLPDGDVDYQAWSNNLWTKFEYDGRGMISSVLHRNTQLGQDLAKREYWRNDRDQILAWKGPVRQRSQCDGGRTGAIGSPVLRQFDGLGRRVTHG